MSSKGKKIHRIQSDLQDSLLEERLKIANVILPEDNLEDLVQLPIAPELVSRRLRARRARENSPAALNSLAPRSSPLLPLDSLPLHSSSPTDSHHPLAFFTHHQQLKSATPDSSLESSDDDQSHTPFALDSSSPAQHPSTASAHLSAIPFFQSHSQPNNPTSAPHTHPVVEFPNLSPNHEDASSALGLVKASGIPQRSRPPQASSTLNPTQEPESSSRNRNTSLTSVTPSLRPQQQPHSHIKPSPLASRHKSPSHVLESGSKTSTSSQPLSNQRKRTQSSTHRLNGTNSSPRSTTVAKQKAKSSVSNRKASDPSQNSSKTHRQRPRSLSASSVVDAPLPPWSTDPSPRIYRVNPQSKDATPRFDDLILPAVARQLEKQQNLVFLDSSNPSARPTVDLSEWEPSGTPMLVREVSHDKSTEGFPRPQTAPLPVDSIPYPATLDPDSPIQGEESAAQEEQSSEPTTSTDNRISTALPQLSIPSPVSKPNSNSNQLSSQSAPLRHRVPQPLYQTSGSRSSHGNHEEPLPVLTVEPPRQTIQPSAPQEDENHTASCCRCSIM